MICAPQRSSFQSDLWGVCAYFNPMGYRRRLENYRHFRAHLAIPLVTVELAAEGHFELAGDDADVLIRCDSADVMWQRERMINLAVSAVPEDCQKIARLDGDVIFDTPDWPQIASRQLDEYPLVQLFTQAFDQPRESSPGSTCFPDRTRAWEAFASHWQREHDPRIIDRRQQVRERRSSCSMGLAWAFRRELHTDLGLYDCCVLGGAEHAVLAAACGVPEIVVDYQRMGAARGEHYMDWATRFQKLVAGRFGIVPGQVNHLWHGDIRHRGYGTRYHGFEGFDFDPALDIRHNGAGVWQWATDKPAMHDYVRSYFSSRREDG